MANEVKRHEEPNDQANRGSRSINLAARFVPLSIAFSIIIIILVIASLIGFKALSGARAYVHGESQWTKAQKQSVIYLLEYARTGNELLFDLHQQALEVNRGDRRARETLDSLDPDYNLAREGFLAGRNHGDDISLMIRLFEIASPIDFFQRAVSAWESADEKLEQLVVAGAELRTIVHESGLGSQAIEDQIDRIMVLDGELTELENEFSSLMGKLSRRIDHLFSLLIVISALMLMVAGQLLAIRLMRSTERSERALLESEQRYRALVDQPEVGMWHLDDAGRIQYLNPAMRVLLGIGATESIHGGEMSSFVVPTYMDQISNDRIARSRGEATTSEVELLSTSGERKTVLVHGAPILVNDGKLVGHVGTCLDITDRKKAEEQLRHQAFHDSLTGLPNRALFMDRLEMALKRARREKTRLAVLFVDLDRFKVVNDSMGHGCGDAILRGAAQRLAGAVRDHDTLGRFGGDEFGLILESIERPSDIDEPAGRIVQATQADFMLEDIKIRIGCSIGVAISDGGREASDLLRQSDIAMYEAKRKGGNCWHVFDPGNDAPQMERLQLENQLWAAVENNQLLVHYQPVVELQSGKIISLEALVRWQHPQRGLLLPDEFIPLAEETGAIVSISEWVTGQAIHDMTILDNATKSDTPEAMAVNISAAEFRFSNPVEKFAMMARNAGIKPERLEFEVTESLLMQDPGAIARLEQAGFGVALDDFGTGYASLDRIRQMRFSTIKIDRVFIREISENQMDQAIVESIIVLGKQVGIKVIAEGIEEVDQRRKLIELGCELGQGYLFARPMTLEQLLDHFGNLWL